MSGIQDNYELKKTINVQDVMVARVITNTRGEYKAENPVYAAPTLSIKSQSKFNSAEFSGDGIVMQTISTFAGGTLDIKLADLSLAARAYIYGYEIDKNGVMVGREQQIPGPLALGYRYKMSNGKFGFVWYYNVTFGSGETISYDAIVNGKVKGDDAEIKATFQPRLKDGLYRAEATESEIVELGLTTPEAILSAWFTQVVEPDLASLKLMSYNKATPIQTQVIPPVETAPQA